MAYIEPEELAYRATHDSLTGLLNRRGLEEMFPQSLSQLHVNTIRTVFFFDLDKFKQINDEFGHAVGDDFLGAGGRGKDLSAELFQCGARRRRKTSEPGVDVFGERFVSHVGISA